MNQNKIRTVRPPQKTEKARPKLYFTFTQNNSGGFFIKDAEAGICEYVIVEAYSAEQAQEIFNKIGEDVSGFHEFCSCCGQRWDDDWLDEEDGKLLPMIYNKDVFKDVCRSIYCERCFIHYLDGEIIEVTFRAKDPDKEPFKLSDRAQKMLAEAREEVEDEQKKTTL